MKKTQDISNDELIIGIAKIRGWTRLIVCGTGTDQFAADGFTGIHGTVPWAEAPFPEDGSGIGSAMLNKGALDWYKQRPPKYPQDLNAMHAIEMSLTDKEYDTYWNHLVEVCIRDGHERINSATARQRAEAFVLTMG